ncbi:hypothetical protein RJ641_023442 [Dillenia turbinata]|uniref:60S ribosomal protein L18a-like protein n=1 Tax=Dillenia turbinata TaxID=194707 RepID=A0AAN8UCE2_9MAGN
MEAGSSLSVEGNRSVNIIRLSSANQGENVDRDMAAQPTGIAGIHDKPLPCFGCGIGWFSFVLGFVFPPLWYCATIIFFIDYHHKDPRERAGLAASAIAALICSVGGLIALLVIFF